MFERVQRKSCTRVKGNGCLVQYNTVLCAPTKENRNLARLDNRDGSRNRWIANYMENSRGMVIHDVDNVVRGNVCSGTYTYLDVMAGVTGSSIDAEHPACQRGDFDDNAGKIRVGFEYYSAGTILNAQNNTVRGQRTMANVKLYPYQTATQLLEQ